MTQDTIRLHAGSENGPVITFARAVSIVASGGTVHAAAHDGLGLPIWGIRASVSTSRSIMTGEVTREPKVRWTSLSDNDLETASLHAKIVETCVRVGRKALAAPDRFDTVPSYIGELSTASEEALCWWAAHAYCSGEGDERWAWRQALERAKGGGTS